MEEKKFEAKKKSVRRSIPGLLSFLFREIFYQRRWVLLPLWVLLAVLALIFFVFGSAAILPAIYIGF